MHDFTTDALHLLLSSLKTAGYEFTAVADYLRNPSPVTVILRHDVDARRMNALYCARMEKNLGIRGTYYFRMNRRSFDENVIREISNLGHEIGYHYEDLATAHGNYNLAIKHFETNLAKLRQLVPIETICMHGSPLSRYDNRLLWKKYNYKNYGLIGEPYLDLDFKELLYLTDTGRCWNGFRYNLRDKISHNHELINENHKDYSNSHLKDNCSTLQTSFDIINAANDKRLPSKILVTIHPQRWNSKTLPWLKEIVWQNIKNLGKSILTKK